MHVCLSCSIHILCIVYCILYACVCAGGGSLSWHSLQTLADTV